MLTFYEYLARSKKMVLPDTHTMLAMAGVPLDVPDDEQTKRLLNRDRKQRPPVGRKPHRSLDRLDGQPTPSGGGRS